MMENKSKPTQFQPLSYASALRGKQGARIEVKPKPTPAPTPTPTPAPTPAPKSEVTFKLAATALPWKPNVQQPPPAVPDLRKVEQAKSARHTNPTPTPSRNEFPQLSRSVANPKLAAVSYAQAVTGKRTAALVVKKQENQAPKEDLKRAEGDATMPQGLKKSPQEEEEKGTEKGPQKPPEKSPDKAPQKSLETSAKKSQKKSPNKKKKKANTSQAATTEVSDSTIKAQLISHQPKLSKQGPDPEKKTAATIERGLTAHQGGGLPRENTRSNSACVNAAADANTPRKNVNIKPRGRSPVKAASPCIPNKPKGAAWAERNWRSPAAIRPRQRSTTFPGFESSSHPFHTQSSALTARYQLCQSPSTSFATPRFAKQHQYNHHEHRFHPLSKVFSPKMGIPFYSPPESRCRVLGVEQPTRAAARSHRAASNALGPDEFAIQCDEPGYEGLWPKAVEKQKRIARFINKHDRKELDLFVSPRDWDMRIDCGPRTFLVHRQMLTREYTHMQKAASVVIPDGSSSRLVVDYTTPDRMANVLAFLYDKSIMKEDRFVPSPDRPLDGGIILNNVLAFIAGMETGCASLCSSAVDNLVPAIEGVTGFLNNHVSIYQASVDEAKSRGAPSEEWDCLSPFVSDEELVGFYKPYRIAVQAMMDCAAYKPDMWFFDDLAQPMRRWMWVLGRSVHGCLLLSKAFRDLEQPLWEESGLQKFCDDDVRLLRDD